MESTHMGYLFWARANVPISVTVRATGGSGTSGISASVAANIGTDWTQIRNEFDVTSAPGAFGDWAPNIVHSSGAIGDWMEVTELVTYSGHYEGEYFDGDTPEAVWEANPRTSRSRRYPYTLESVAGSLPPFSSSTQTPESPPVLATANWSRGVTIYSVADRPVAGDAFGIALRDSISTQRLYIFHNVTQALVAGQNAGGAQLSTSQSITQGTHVISGGMPPGQAFVRGRPDLQPSLQANLTFSPSTIAPTVLAKSPVNGGRSIIAHVFNEYHDDTRAAAVHRWLANKYGFALAA